MCSVIKVKVKQIFVHFQCYGVAEGVSRKTFIQMAANNSMKPSVFTPKGAETLQEVKARGTEFLKSVIEEIGRSHINSCSGHTQTDSCISSDIIDELQSSGCEMLEKQKQPSQLANVLIVSHGGVIRQLLRYFVDDLQSEFPIGANRHVSIVSPNTGISKLKISINEETKLPEFVECICLHSTEHLAKDKGSK